LGTHRPAACRNQGRRNLAPGSGHDAPDPGLKAREALTRMRVESGKGTQILHRVMMSAPRSQVKSGTRRVKASARKFWSSASAVMR